MTNAEFVLDGRVFTARITGHANYDSTGRDIVCSALSIVTQALAVSLCRINGAEFSYKEEAGDVAILCRLPKERAARQMGKGMIRMGQEAFTMLSHAYPENVSFSYTDRRKNRGEKAGAI